MRLRRLELNFRKEGGKKEKYSVGHQNQMSVWISMVKNVREKHIRREIKAHRICLNYRKKT